MAHAEPALKNVSIPKRRQPESLFLTCSSAYETRRDKALRPHGIPIAICRPQRIRCCPETPTRRDRQPDNNTGDFTVRGRGIRESGRRRSQWGANVGRRVERMVRTPYGPFATTSTAQPGGNAVLL